MGRNADPRVEQAYWHVTQGGMNPSQACRHVSIARSSLYKYESFRKYKKLKDKGNK